MTTLSLDTFTRQATSDLISFYQKQISPHKGFACAHRVLHWDESCSQYIKRVILERGLQSAIPLIQERFEDCRVANEILKARRERQKRQQHWRSLQIEQELPQPDPDSLPDIDPSLPAVEAEAAKAVGKKLQRESPCGQCDCGDTLDCADVFVDGTDCLPDCGSFEWSGMDCGTPDCSGLDCGSLDCSSLDCSSLDCGSCG